MAQILQEKDENLVTEFFNFILNGPTIKADKNDLTLFNEGFMKTVQQNSLKTLKQLLFGSKYDKLKYERANFFNDQFKRL